MKAAVEHYAEYRRRLRKAKVHAPTDSPLGRTLDDHKDVLDATFRGDADQVSWWDEALPKLEAQLVSAAPPAATPAISASVTFSTPPMALPDVPDPPPLAPVAMIGSADARPPWTAERGVFRGRKFTALETAIGAINLIIVAASGLSVLYFANSTFGSFADYLTLALWGSTATAGLALLRRLVPGALTTSQPGVGG